MCAWSFTSATISLPSELHWTCLVPHKDELQQRHLLKRVWNGNHNKDVGRIFGGGMITCHSMTKKWSQCHIQFLLLLMFWNFGFKCRSNGTQPSGGKKKRENYMQDEDKLKEWRNKKTNVSTCKYNSRTSELTTHLVWAFTANGRFQKQAMQWKPPWRRKEDQS